MRSLYLQRCCVDDPKEGPHVRPVAAPCNRSPAFQGWVTDALPVGFVGVDVFSRSLIFSDDAGRAYAVSPEDAETIAKMYASKGAKP